MKNLLTIFFIALSTLTFAQKVKYSTKNKKAIASFEKARIFYDQRKDEDCKKELEKAIEQDENFYEAHNLMGYLAIDSRDAELAISSFNKAIEIDPKTPQPYYNLSQVYLAEKRFDDCISSTNTFLKLKPSLILEKKAQKIKEIAVFRKNAYANPVPFKPKNVGDKINTDKDEYHPVLTVDESTLIFTKKFDKSKSKQTEDIFYSVKDADGNWGSAKSMGEPINTPNNEGAYCLSPDGQIFFYSADYDEGKGGMDIYYSKWEGKKWSSPRNLGRPINTSFWDAQPSFASDGKTLYFASSRNKTGNQNSNIYYTQLSAQGWSAPQKLPFNSNGDEMSPFIHPDGKTLYFSSNGLTGMGGFDIYRITKNEDGKWGTPENLGYPINTEADEYAMIVNSSGDLAYFASDRDGGFGWLDIYSFELDERLRPDKVTYMKGKVYDAETKEPLSAKFELLDLKFGVTKVESYSNQFNGEFLVPLPVNQDYALEASKEGYMFFSENFSLKGMQDGKPYVMDVPMQPIKVGSSVVLNNVFFETGKFDLKPESKTELNKLVEFLNKNITLKIELSGHTDNVGGKEANQLLSENRAKSVMNYLSENGVLSDRLSYKGYGDTKPIETNDTEEGRAKNRRTEFKIISVE